MAFTVGYALLGALMVALFLIPGLAYVLYKRPQKTFHNKWLEKITISYKRQTAQIMARPKSVFSPLALVLIGAIILTITVGKDFLPQLDEGSLWLQVQLPPGISIDKSKEMSDTLRHRLIKYDEVSHVMFQTGRDDQGVDPFSLSHIECSIGLKPYGEWKNGKRKSH